ncbi:MAG: protein translocase subunit SecF [Sutterella parvirubra]|uniref:Protein-export membrane protein SecF n=1 Tax=Sutterella parvirubra YIT 11816 TaxID=762967 RepID=H3KCR6_9BURK|nr:protein translocase subunit SecF [Sutterella parvirubra]EHY32084.1 export membrane protein SecF [Sutterella parvirubra YIT 11816]MCI7709228.1 protein translocase subunit SecF [Sutterella parvirubra]MDR3769775.1 protein translocase subunit SecF [Sutterella sp.]MDY5200827.1 protein translocase subunit SecF [Sutterella parvirubra]
MELFRIQKTIPFMHYRHVLNSISLVSFLVAVYWIFAHGLAFSIEFTGGTQMEVNFPEAANTEQVRNDLAQVSKEVLVQTFGTPRDVVVRVPTKEGQSSGEVAAEVMRVLEASNPGVVLKSTEFVGPQVGDELARDGGTALALVVVGIMIYLAFRFEWKFALAAIIANLHDVVIVVGIFSVMQWEFTLPVLAAVLAVLGYSVNESVIIFDRVREHFRKMRRADTMEVINSAITATISRTVITHTSTLCMTLSMFFFGGPALHYFSLALTIGILLGVYSSVFVAAAIALYLGVKREDLVKVVKKDEVEEMVP